MLDLFLRRATSSTKRSPTSLVTLLHLDYHGERSRVFPNCIDQSLKSHRYLRAAILFFPPAAYSPGVSRIGPRCRSLLPGIPAGELTSPVGLICITVTSSFELVVVILQSERDANASEKGRRTEVPLAGVPPPKCIAGGSSDTHNNHNNGISRVTRGPPPRIGAAHRTAHVTPSWAATRQAGEPSRRVVFPRLYAGATTQPDCGPSGFRSEFSRRAPTAQRARPRCPGEDSARASRPAA